MGASMEGEIDHAENKGALMECADRSKQSIRKGHKWRKVPEVGGGQKREPRRKSSKVKDRQVERTKKNGHLRQSPHRYEGRQRESLIWAISVASFGHFKMPLRAVSVLW